MITHIGLGVGAGLVSALLYSVIATGSPPGIFLRPLAPLPILIVALGWHHLVGLLALSVGALAASAFLRGPAGVDFALGTGLPAWALAYLTLALRPSQGSVRWLSPGSLLLATALAASAVVLGTAIALGGGDHARYTERLGRALSIFLRAQAGLPRDAALPDVFGMPAATLVQWGVAVAPAGIASLLTTTLALNLVGAAKIVDVSGRLPRPWPRLATARMPSFAVYVLGGGAVLSAVPGFPGVAGTAMVGGLVIAFALQGLALLHDVSRGRAGRGFLLTLTYLFAIFAPQVFVPLLALTGLLDSTTPVRRILGNRRPPGARPPPPTH